MADSLLAREDSAVFFALFAPRKQALKKQMEQADISKHRKQRPASRSPFTPPGNRFIDITGGYVTSASNFRSIIDTPYSEKNIMQHDLAGRLQFTICQTLPLQLVYRIRNTNSSIFRDIYDVQLSLDPNGVRQLVASRLKQRLAGMESFHSDSLMAKMLNLKSQDLNITREWLKSPIQNQRILEAKEILSMPGITFQPQLSPEENQRREEKMRDKSSRFLKLYNTVDSLYTLSSAQLDSLEADYVIVQKNTARIRAIEKNGFGNYQDYLTWDRDPRHGSENNSISSGYGRLSAIRTLALGRSFVNYSDLTAKNVSIRGINFEYNSWYYLALVAGFVDAPFRDLAVISSVKKKQSLAMVRLGIGSLEKNNIIFSGFAGRKQLFTSTSNQSGLTTIDVTGISVQGRWQLQKNISVFAEAAQSRSPDFRSGDLSNRTKFGLTDQGNQAFSVKLLSYYPLSKTRVDAGYKKTGVNYQSFSSYQTNAQFASWYVKAEQQLFGRVVKLSAAVKTNDFSNPSIVQRYQSNTLFKSFNLAVRKPGWPVLSVGYQPMSQLTSLNGVVYENRFQVLNATSYHYYSVGSIKTASTVMFNKFYNRTQDSGFVYFNASNIYFGQNIFIGTVVGNLAVSVTRNDQYQSQVFDESIQMNVTKRCRMLIGTKINNLSNQEVRVGGYANTSVRIWAADILALSMERSFLPGFGKKLTRNDIASVQFTKYFGSVH